jgi:signal transduction histidine kinase
MGIGDAVRAWFRGEDREAALARAMQAALDEKLKAELKAARAERMATIGWLAASVAHEVRNPLSSIKSIAQVLLAETGPGHRWQADLEVVVREADRLDAAIERLLATSRPAAGRGEEVDLAHEIERLRAALGPQAEARGVRFDVRLGSGANRIKTRTSDLWEIFYNLAINALDAMPSGGVVRIEEVAAAGAALPEVRVLVSDTGPGIAAADRPLVFDSLFTTKPDGHGLGLGIVKRRLLTLGGRIRLLSGEGGAVFEVTLPCE